LVTVAGPLSTEASKKEIGAIVLRLYERLLSALLPSQGLKYFFEDLTTPTAYPLKKITQKKIG